MKAQTITSPQIRCVSVLPNGNISISWQIPPDPAHEFSSYQIYISSSGTAGTYTQQPSILVYGTNNYTFTGITNGNTQPYFIYIQTITTGGVTVPEQNTVRTIFLTATGVNPSATPVLNWSGFLSPLPAGEAAVFNVYRQRTLSTNPWVPIATVPVHTNGSNNYSYVDSIQGICNLDSARYKIELNDNATGCVSISNVSLWRQIKDKNAPTIPLFDSVSVDAAGNPIMGINPAYSADVKCYIIYYFITGTANDVDSVCSANTPTLYTYTAVSANTGSQEFSTAALDSCGNIGTIAFNQQKTIYTSASYSACIHANVIQWNAYENMTTGVKNYEIYCSTAGGPYISLGDTTATVFIQRNVLLGTTYCYFVRAHSVGKKTNGKDTASSTSNKFCVTTLNPKEPTFVYLANVSVNTQQTIDVLWNVIKTDPISSFNLYRATTRNGPYTFMANIPFTAGTGNYSYTDNNVNTHTQEYFYYITVLDNPCNNTVLTSDTSNSIVLKAQPQSNLQALLSWNDYAQYAGGVSGYNIYRAVNGTFSQAAFVPFGTNSYVDDLSPFATDQGIFYYYVEAVENAPDSFGLQKSQSNIDTIYVDANMYIPNAFSPNSVHSANKVFLPVGSFLANSNYLLRIFDRWGQKIYETSDPNQGWDGGSYLQDVYAYTLQYETSLGEFKQRTGTVTLIR